MKTQALALVVSMIVTASAWAAPNSSQMSPLTGVNLMCGVKGAGLAFDTRSNKVWQITKHKDTQGVQHKDVKIKALSCKNCYEIESVTETNGEKTNYKTVISPDKSGKKLVGKMTMSGKGRKPASSAPINLECRTR